MVEICCDGIFGSKEEIVEVELPPGEVRPGELEGFEVTDEEERKWERQKVLEKKIEEGQKNPKPWLMADEGKIVPERMIDDRNRMRMREEIERKEPEMYEAWKEGDTDKLLRTIHDEVLLKHQKPDFYERYDNGEIDDPNMAWIAAETKDNYPREFRRMERGEYPGGGVINGVAVDMVWSVGRLKELNYEKYLDWRAGEAGGKDLKELEEEAAEGHEKNKPFGQIDISEMFPEIYRKRKRRKISEKEYLDRVSEEINTPQEMKRLPGEILHRRSEVEKRRGWRIRLARRKYNETGNEEYRKAEIELRNQGRREMKRALSNSGSRDYRCEHLKKKYGRENSFLPVAEDPFEKVKKEVERMSTDPSYRWTLKRYCEETIEREGYNPSFGRLFVVGIPN